jgi:hypothetical protein
MKIANSNGTRRRSSRANGHTEPAGSLEASIQKMARNGDLAKAAQQAIRRLRRKGLPITFQRGMTIIKQHADGREEILGVVKPVEYRLPKGVKIIPQRANGEA